MYKRKIIQKNLKTKRRLRRECGLQTQFTTYPTYEQTQNLSDSSQPLSSFDDEWYIILEEDTWERQQPMSLFSNYQIQEKPQESVVFLKQNRSSDEISAENIQQLGFSHANQGCKPQNLSFEEVSNSKIFSQVLISFQINGVQEQLSQLIIQD